jgi:hypothetical protein
MQPQSMLSQDPSASEPQEPASQTPPPLELRADPPPSPGPAPPAASAPETGAPLWPRRVTSIAESTCRWVGRPRVRLSLAGVMLLLIGAVLVTNSVWTLPIVVIGALMVVVAWIGHRLEGRFAIEWGEGGTELAFRATIKAVEPAHEGAPPALSADQEPASPAEPEDGDRVEIIEGEAHTVEIDVAELRALIAAAESAESPPPRATASPSDIRIRRAVDVIRASEPAR